MARFLIVDDDEQNLNLLQELLEAHGHKVVSAVNGAEALEIAQSDPPDIIISDILMPVMDGFALCHRWKANDKLKKIPFVFYTATYTDPKDKEFGLSLGAERFIIKPAPISVLMDMVQDVFEEQKAGRLVTSREQVEEEAVFYKEYNEALVRKLEDRTIKLEKVNRNLLALQDAFAALVGSLNLDEVLKSIGKGAVEALAGNALWILAVNDVGDALESKVMVTLSEEDELALEKAPGFDIDTVTIPIVSDKNRMYDTVLSGESVFVPDLSEMARDAGQPEMLTELRRVIDFEALAVVPLLVKERVLGMMILTRPSVGEIHPEEKQLIIAFARQAAIAIENASLFEKEQQRTYDLGERVKEQTCLYGISDLIGDPNAPREDVLQGITDLIPAGWQYPDITCARIIFQGQEYKTDNFRETAWKQASNIVVDGEQYGTIEVYYLEEQPEEDEGSFLNEERSLLDAITGRLELMSIRYRAEEAKKRLETRLRQAQKLETIGTLAGGIAHDFNNILTPIFGYLALVQQDMSIESSTREKLEHVDKAAKRARDLVQQILVFSRQVEQERRPVQVHILVKEALKLLKATLPSTIEMRQNIDIGSGQVLADPTQIHQVLMNLCTNAYHAMHESGGVLEVNLSSIGVDTEFASLHPNLQVGPHIRIAVSDTGHGMDNETVEHIFEPFYTTKEVGEGTGLGLSVVHGIVVSLGGEITVYSDPGKGTTFLVYLPQVGSEVEQEDLRDETILEGSERILFVDDEYMITQLGKEMLTGFGYDVTVKTVSTEALEEFRTHPDDFDLVITDQTMPVMTGIKLAGELLSIRPDIPIILTSGFNEAITTEKIKEVGIRKFVLKPFYSPEFSRIIRQVLDEE